MTPNTEDTLEQQSKLWFEQINYTTVFGPGIAPEALTKECRFSGWNRMDLV